jgi:hypothetical protein
LLTAAPVPVFSIAPIRRQNFVFSIKAIASSPLVPGEYAETPRGEP